MTGKEAKMDEETTLLSPGDHEIRLKLIAIATPMDRDIAVVKYALYFLRVFCRE